MTTIGILGGTGPLGRGLAARWTRAGHDVVVGSRDPAKAEQAVERLVDEGAPAERLAGRDNAAAAAGEVVIISLPYDAQAAALPDLADAIGERVVCSAVVPLGFDDDGPFLRADPAGSAAEAAAALLPRARLVAGLHAVSSKRLRRVDEPVDADALLCGDDPGALDAVGALVADIDGLTPRVVGPLRLAGPLEGQTPVLLSYNQRERTEAGIRLVAH